MSINIERLAPMLGAEITGVNLSRPLRNEEFSKIYDALTEHKVIAFPQQDLSHDAYESFAQRFGDLYLTPTRDEAQPSAVHELRTDETSTSAFGETWHSDMTSEEKPPMATMLRLVQTPKYGGGDTMFADMYTAYDMLSKKMKNFLDGMTALHDSSIFVRKYGTTKKLPSAIHPVVRTHPTSGRKALFVNTRFTTRINELSESESGALLAFLFRHIAETPYFQLRLRWAPNTLVLWDNRCTQHCAIFDYWPQLRLGYRVMIRGDRPV